MNGGEIDKYPVSQLPARYSLARSAVYKRMEQLGITAERVGQRAYVTAAQVRLLDELHQFIQRGGNATEFVEARGLRPDFPRPTANGGEPSSALANMPGDLGKFISLIVAEVINRVQGPSGPDPLHYFDRLEAAAQNGWLLGTSEIADLLDLSPTEIEQFGDSFFEAGFVFRRSGYRKRGEIAWRVTKRLK